MRLLLEPFWHKITIALPNQKNAYVSRQFHVVIIAAQHSIFSLSSGKLTVLSKMNYAPFTN